MPDTRLTHLPDPPPPARTAFGAAAGGPARPSGLPIFATERLSYAERDALHALRRRYEIAAAHCVDAIESGTVAGALEVLRETAAFVDGQAAIVAGRLGSRR